MAAIAEGTKELINYTASELAKLPPLKIYEVEPEPVEDFTQPKTRNFTLKKEDDVYIIEAEWLLKILETVDPTDYESLQYFQRVLQSSGIIDALIKAGVQDGDTVSVYDIEFDYVS
jgi:GTP-binding protein